MVASLVHTRWSKQRIAGKYQPKLNVCSTPPPQLAGNSSGIAMGSMPGKFGFTKAALFVLPRFISNRTDSSVGGISSQGSVDQFPVCLPRFALFGNLLESEFR
jgi:hypothetical protein